MSGPRLLDAYCGPGGAAVGYHAAGFRVTGVDKDDQPDYPYDFVQSDALTYIAEHGHEYDFIHASPPCWAATALSLGTNAKHGKRYEQLIPATRTALKKTGLPWIIENVPTHLLRRDLLLCGEMFGLRVLRHRIFEAGGGFMPEQPVHVAHRGKVRGHRHGQNSEGYYFAVYGDGGSTGKGTTAQWQEAMGIWHTSNRHSLAQAIPPAYTHYIGGQVVEFLGRTSVDDAQ